MQDRFYVEYLFRFTRPKLALSVRGENQVFELKNKNEVQQKKKNGMQACVRLKHLKEGVEVVWATSGFMLRNTED